MKVFISWSGELSRRLGEVLRRWLPGTLQFVKPYFTPADIEKGARWNTEIAQQLAESSIGIFCLTPDNLQSSWLMFEAGALSKQVGQSHVCPILFDVDNADLKGPLIHFQTTVFGRDDMLRLAHTVNSCAGENRLEKDVLESAFDTWWPKLDSRVTAILDEHKRNAGEDAGKVSGIRPDRELLEEILELVRLVSADMKSSQDKGSSSREHRLNDRLEKIMERVVDRPNRRYLPDDRQSITHQFSLAGHEGVFTIGLYDDGSPGELFITMTKEGSTVGGMMDALASAVTLGLQYGIPLVVLVDTFRHSRFEPSGMTSDSDIPFAKSIVDYIFAWIGTEFIPGYRGTGFPRPSPAKTTEEPPKQQTTENAKGSAGPRQTG